MKNSKCILAKAIAQTLVGTAFYIGGLSAASAAAITMYNTYTTINPTATDGWVYGFCSSCSNSTRAIAYNASNPQALIGTFDGKTYNGFVGTDPSNRSAFSPILPFGYGGTSHLNWAVQLGQGGDAAEISQADAVNRYGFAAEIDTGGGAWRDDGSANSFGLQTGWKHQTDVGLIKTDTTLTVTLNLTNLSEDPNIYSPRFGITIFEGMDQKTTAYVHHGSWNNPVAIPAAPGGTPPAQIAHPYNMSNPWGTIGLSYLKHSDFVDNTALNALSFTAEAGKVYSIYLGGVDFGDWNDKLADYKLQITSVPAPPSLWLTGVGLLALRRFSRKKSR